MGQNTTRRTSGYNTGSLVLLTLYKWSDPSKPNLFADDANIIIKNLVSSTFNWGFNNIIDNINYADVNHCHWIFIKLNFYNFYLK